MAKELVLFGGVEKLNVPCFNHVKSESDLEEGMPPKYKLPEPPIVGDRP
jgi:hypothetical protein